jgi:cell division septum initiation protein DivIVA
MPITPEDINPSKLPVGMRGYQREATDTFLKLVAWDYRQVVRNQTASAEEAERLKKQVAELEARIESEREALGRKHMELRGQYDEELREQREALEAEVARLKSQVGAHEDRDELTRALLSNAQRAARELRDAARAECEALLKAARKRATEIEEEARASVRQSSLEVSRLQTIEHDLRDQLRRTLQAVLGNEQPPQAQPETPFD